MPHLSRRRLLRLAGYGSTLGALPCSAWSQAYPSRPITIVVFVGAGGGPDIAARILAQGLSQRLGQPVVIENRPGGGGNLALQAVARAPADGYTVLLIASPHAVNVTLYPKQEFSVLRDIVPVASIDNDPFAMVINPSIPAKTVSEFVTYAKANAGKINLASSGSGNLSHLAGELFKMMTGIELVHVPYRGMPAANTAVMTGEAHVLFNALPAVVPLIKDGKLRPLAVTSEKPVAVLPGVPTVAASVPGYIVTGWLGLGVPKNTPSDVVARLNRETNALLSDPKVATQFTNMGSEPFTGSPEDFGRFIAADTKKWADVVKFANLKVN